MSVASQPDLSQQRAENPIGGEIFPGERPRRAAVGRIVGGNRVDGSQCLLFGRVWKQAAPSRIEFVEARAHRYNRPAGGEIANAAITEPPAVRPHINILRYGELAARTSDEIAVTRHIGRDRARIDKAPAALRYQRAHSLVRN